MFTISINEKEYKVRFGMNSFADTDLMDRTKRLLKLFSDDDSSNDDMADVAKELFVCVRDLFYYGFMKYNKVESPQAVGDLLDDYIDEAPEGEKRTILGLFEMIGEELLNQGFLDDLMSGSEGTEAEKTKTTPKVVKKK